MNFRIRRNLQKLLAIRQALSLSNTVTRTTMAMVEEEVDEEAMDVEIPTVDKKGGKCLYVFCVINLFIMNLKTFITYLKHQ